MVLRGLRGLCTSLHFHIYLLSLLSPRFELKSKRYITSPAEDKEAEI